MKRTRGRDTVSFNSRLDIPIGSTARNVWLWLKNKSRKKKGEKGKKSQPRCNGTSQLRDNTLVSAEIVPRNFPTSRYIYISTYSTTLRSRRSANSLILSRNSALYSQTHGTLHDFSETDRVTSFPLYTIPRAFPAPGISSGAEWEQRLRCRWASKWVMERGREGRDTGTLI